VPIAINDAVKLALNVGRRCTVTAQQSMPAEADGFVGRERWMTSAARVAF
jgi:hypothetical protein